MIIARFSKKRPEPRPQVTKDIEQMKQELDYKKEKKRLKLEKKKAKGS